MDSEELAQAESDEVLRDSESQDSQDGLEAAVPKSIDVDTGVNDDSGVLASGEKGAGTKSKKKKKKKKKEKEKKKKKATKKKRKGEKGPKDKNEDDNDDDDKNTMETSVPETQISIVAERGPDEEDDDKDEASASTPTMTVPTETTTEIDEEANLTLPQKEQQLGQEDDTSTTTTEIDEEAEKNLAMLQQLGVIDVDDSRPASTMTSEEPPVFKEPRVFKVDGSPLEHWEMSNFERSRDETARIIYKPVEEDFFAKNLRESDFTVLRQEKMEQPFFSKYNRFYPESGHFCCKACGHALYSVEAKLKRHDGWPAFGACVEGAVALTPAEDRESRRLATIRIQAFVRGCLARAKVNYLLGKLIDQVLIQQPETSTGPQVADSKILSLSLHSLEEYSILHDDSLSGDDDSFAGAESVGEANAEFKSTALTNGDSFIEIHCHRCKSHLGNILAEENKGRDGLKLYKERHRVNGRALKYIEDNLSKRVRADCSLLFANSTQRRLLGLKPAKEMKPATNTKFALLRAHLRRRQLETDRPSMSSKPGEGVLRQSPEILVRKKNELESFFLNQTVH